MKSCSYCGREEQDSAMVCRGCGLELPPDEASGKPSPPPPPRLIEEDTVAQAVTFADGFHYVDWEIIMHWIDARVPSAQREETWSEAALVWAGMLRDDLGGDYVVTASHSTILVSDQNSGTTRWMLEYADRCVATIKAYLGATAWNSAFGKHVLLVFSDEDDYYQYLSHYDSEGEHAGSGGVCIHSGYTHIAVPWHEEFQAANALAHELTHDCLAHLPLPLWLNEGVAVILQKAIAPRPRALGEGDQQAVLSSTIDWHPPVMWDELAERHFAFWNESNIQAFWAGTSFVEPGDSNELSYSLAEVIVTLLAERGSKGALRAYLERARQDDAGQAAAFDVLGTDLGKIAESFLGNGRWSPREKEMIRHWEQTGWRSGKGEPPNEPLIGGSNWVPSS